MSYLISPVCNQPCWQNHAVLSPKNTEYRDVVRTCLLTFNVRINVCA